MKRTGLNIVFIIAFFLNCCSPPPVQHSVPTPVNLFTAKAVHVLYYDKYPANTVALNQVDLRAEVQGYITGISFKEGSHVHRGQELYEIDQRLYKDAFEQAKANLDIAKGNLTQNQQDADRYTFLNKTDAVAKQILDHQIISLEQAKSSVKSAEEALKIAQTNLNYSVITAPFDGTIGISQVRLGNAVTVGQTILNTISSDNPMGVDFLISEKQLQFFDNLMNDKISSVDSLFTIILPNGNLYPYPGKLYLIDRAVDPQTGTIRVRVSFPNPDYSMKPGLSCILRVHSQDTVPQILIPNKAVVELMGEYFVYVAKDTVIHDPQDSVKTSPAMMAIQKKVQLGQIIPPNIIILKGISEGERIVTDGVQSLHSGSYISTGQKVTNPVMDKPIDNKKAKVN